MRHTFIRQAFVDAVAIEVVSELAGHASLATTSFYSSRASSRGELATQYAVAMDRIEAKNDSCRVPDEPVGTIRWVNVATARYYEATLQLNLFSECEVQTVWGGVGSPRGGHQCHPVSNPAAGVELVAAIARRRQKRGYERSGLDAYTLALAVQPDELRTVVGEVMVSLRKK